MPPTSYRHHYTLRDLQLLVEDTQVLKQMDSELLDDYYHEFLAISNSLLEDDWLSSRRRDSLYLQGFPKAFRSQVLQRLSQTRPSVLSYEVYDFQDVHSAALFLLSENSSGSRQQDISKLREEIANLVKLVSANAETPQFFPSTTPGGVVQNPPQWGRACAFCSSAEHLIYNCPTASSYLEQGWIARYDSGRFCLPGGYPLPLLFPGANLQARADSYWTSLQPCEGEQSYGDVFATTSPEGSNGYSSYEQADSYWTSREPCEEVRSYSDVFATSEPSSNCPLSYEQLDSHWTSLEPREEVRSYSNVFATTSEPPDIYPSSCEQVDDYWMPLQPREEVRSYGDAFATTLPSGSDNYSSSYDVFLANEGQPPSSNRKDDSSLCYLPDPSASSRRLSDEQHCPGDEFTGDTEEAEDLVESYLADFYEPEDASPEVPSVACDVPSIPSFLFADLFSSIPLSSP